MSRVTNVLLHIGGCDSDSVNGTIVQANAYFEDCDIRGLISLNDPSLPKGWYGGNKYLEAKLYVGAFNHLYLDEFIKHLRSLEWKKPSEVQLIVKEQEEDVFRIVPIFEAEIAELNDKRT